MANGAVPFDAAQDLRLEILRRAPLFSALDDAALMAVADRMDTVTIEGGATLFRAGDTGDALYVVSVGCMAVFDPPDVDGRARIIAEIPAGDIVGELSLIGNRNRSHTVAAIRDSEALRLKRADFERLVQDHPESLVGLMHKLVERYGSPPRAIQRPPRTIALLPLGPGVPMDAFAADLAAALSRLHGAHGKVQTIGVEAAGSPLIALQRAEAESAFVVYRADTADAEWTRRCLRQADVLLLVGRIAAPVPAANAIGFGDLPGDGPFRPRCELVLVRDRPLVRPGATGAWLKGRDYAMHHHVRLGERHDYDHLARMLVNRAVGLVLAGGGARAFAHIGVIRALREARVPVDMVGGSSMGAIVAAAVAAGWEDREIVRRFRHAFVENNPLGDYTFPFVSLFAGRQVEDLLRMAFGALEIEDLGLPFYCVTADLTLQGAHAQRRGSLTRWLRASVSIPGVLPPVVDLRSVHVDGGVIDNFPVGEMRAAGRGPVIGCDIATGDALAGSGGGVETWSARQFLRRLLWRRDQTLPIPSIVSILLRSALVGSAERTLADRKRVDLLFSPPVTDIDLLEWSGFETAIDSGYRHASTVIEQARNGPDWDAHFVA